jgi:transcriptional regulator with XRE-family HTH domain
MQVRELRYYCTVSDYALEALGHVIRQRREALGLTQEELGRAAGYSAASAGVSLSRLESGLLAPRADKLAAIAMELGTTWDSLRAEATSQRSSAGNAESTIDRIRRASAQREELDNLRVVLLTAREQANVKFLEALRDVARRIQGADISRASVSEVTSASDDDVSAEAAYQIKFTRYGVARALDSVDERADLGKFAETVAIGAAAAAATFETALPSATARKGFLAAMGLAARPRILPGGGVLAAVAVGVAVAALLDRQQSQRSRLKKESAARLAAAEDDLARTQPNVDALADIIPKATELFEYVALHAAHAVARWRDQLGGGSLAWDSLSPDQQRRYDDFVEIAAAHLAVATIDLQELAGSTDENLERAVALADQILEQSREAITSRV